MRLIVFKVVLLFWTFFIGLGALVGGISMLVKPDGSILQMQAMLRIFKLCLLRTSYFKITYFPA